MFKLKRTFFLFVRTIILQLKLTNHDGSPVQDTKNDVLIAYGYTYDRSKYLNITRMLDQNGMIHLDLYPPKASDNNSFPLNIEVKLLISSLFFLYLYIIYKYTI